MVHKAELVPLYQKKAKEIAAMIWDMLASETSTGEEIASALRRYKLLGLRYGNSTPRVYTYIYI